MKKSDSASPSPAPTQRVVGPLNLDSLPQMHPQLPPDMARVMVARAALGLGRNGHASGKSLTLNIDTKASHCALHWNTANPSDERQHDSNRITEDGAEAVALAVAHLTKDWQVVRRLQRGEHADWLLEHQAVGKRKLIAFEISGVDRGSIQNRLKTKSNQAGKSADFDHQYAGVVGFEKPEAALRSAAGRDS